MGLIWTLVLLTPLLLAIVAIVTKKLVQFWYYGIPLGDHDLQDGKGAYRRKMCCFILFWILDITELVSGGNVSWNATLISSILLPLIMALTYFKFYYKLSVDSEPKSFTTYVTLSLFLVATLKFTEELFMDSDWAGDLKYFLLRLIVLGVLNFEPLPALITKSDEDKLGNNSEDENTEEKTSGLVSTIKKFYPLAKFLIPSSTTGKVYCGLFYVVTLFESVVNFYDTMYSMKIVESINLDIGNSSNTTSEEFPFLHQINSVRLEFRWDFILIYYGIRFFDRNFLYVIHYYLQQKTETESCSKLQLVLFEKLQNLSLRWHLENQTNEIFSMVSSTPYILKDLIDACSSLIPELVNVSIIVIYMLKYYSFKLSSVVILTAVVSGMIDFYIIRREDRNKEEKRNAESEIRTLRSATFENYETMKYFTNEKYERKNYKKAYFANNDNRLHTILLDNLFSTSRELVRTGAETIVILVVVKAILGNDEGLKAGDYLYFSNVFSTILWPVDTIIQFYKRLQDNVVQMEKISAVLNLVPEITDEPNAPDLAIDKIGGSIEFRNVSFAYVPEREVVKSLSLFIPAGRTVAFVGRSGSGKSTLTKLLFRFYDPTSGEILINGQDIRKVKCMSLRKTIGVVPQEVTLFADTIKYNIQYGKIEATDDEVKESAKVAWLHDRIESFPEKYETEVGNRGLKLSGGEKQRVAIARAALRNPPILLLDEATSSLDTETEKQIQGSLESLCQNRTTVIIAHRLSTIVNVDKIFVLNDGILVESGSHTELLNKDGVYASMWNQQFHNNNNDCKIPTTNSDSEE